VTDVPDGDDVEMTARLLQLSREIVHIKVCIAEALQKICSTDVSKRCTIQDEAWMLLREPTWRGIE